MPEDLPGRLQVKLKPILDRFRAKGWTIFVTRTVHAKVRVSVRMPDDWESARDFDETDQLPKQVERYLSRLE
jgi:hypothetical protein